MTYRSHDGISLCGFFFAFRCVVRRTGFATAFFLTGAGRVLFALTILSYVAVFTLPIPTYYAIKPIGRMVLQSAPMGFLYAL